MDVPERSGQVKRLFVELVDLAPDEREDLLATRCGDDRALRAEVEELLAAHDSGGQRLRRNAFDNPFDPPPMVVQDRLLNERMARYHILRRIGEGGTSFVYSAECDNPPHLVALKVIKPGVASARLLRRFEQC